MERGDSAVQVDRVGCATAAREGRCGGRTDESRFCSASSSTTGRVVSPLMPLTTPGTQHHSTPSSLRTISRKNPARAGAPPRARGARKPDPWARAHYAGSLRPIGFWEEERPRWSGRNAVWRPSAPMGSHPIALRRGRFIKISSSTVVQCHVYYRGNISGYITPWYYRCTLVQYVQHEGNDTGTLLGRPRRTP